MDDTINLNTQILFNHIQKRSEEKETNRVNIYNRILQRVQKKIFLAAKHDIFNINFEVPGIIFGEPIYSVEECSKHITNNLQLNGFNVCLYTKKQLKKLGIKNVNSCIININWESLKKNNENSTNGNSNGNSNNYNNTHNNKHNSTNPSSKIKTIQTINNSNKHSKTKKNFKIM